MIELEKISTLPELMKVLYQEAVPSEEHKQYVDRFLDFKARKRGIPLSGQFELTPLCNLDCKMCYVHLEKDQIDPSRMLSIDTWKDLIDAAIDQGMMFADLTGGECLTYPRFDEVYLYLQKKGIEISIKTNGVLLEEKRITFFKQYPPKEIQISVYGSSEEAYEAVTGRKMYARVMQNIAMAKEAKLPIRIAITPSRFMRDVKEIASWAQKENLPYVINAGLFEPREETGRAGQEIDISIDEYVDIIKYVRHLKGRKPLDQADKDVEDSQEQGVSDGHVRHHPSNIGLRCAAGRSAFDMDWQGRLYACNNLKSIVSHPLDIGFASAWKEIHQKALQYVLPIECDTCKDYDACIKCAAVHQDQPCGHVNPLICQRTRKMREEGLR